MQLRHVVGIALLFAAVPLQMYLMKYSREFRQIVSEISGGLPEFLREKSVDLTGYVKAANGYLRSIYGYLGLSEPFADESLSASDDDDDREVEDHSIRHFRPPHLEFRVGDVVLTRNMVVGAVVGWQIDMSDLTKEPEYFLLVQNHESLVKESQNSMIQIENIQVQHHKLDEYFKQFDGIRYTPKKWLYKMYPKD